MRNLTLTGTRLTSAGGSKLGHAFREQVLQNKDHGSLCGSLNWVPFGRHPQCIYKNPHPFPYFLIVSFFLLLFPKTQCFLVTPDSSAYQLPRHSAGQSVSHHRPVPDATSVYVSPVVSELYLPNESLSKLGPGGLGYHPYVPARVAAKCHPRCVHLRTKRPLSWSVVPGTHLTSVALHTVYRTVCPVSQMYHHGQLGPPQLGGLQELPVLKWSTFCALSPPPVPPLVYPRP